MDINTIVKNIKSQKAKKFDETIELIYSLSFGKGSDTAMRMDLSFPNQFGEAKKVLVLCDQDEAKDAKKADFVGLEEFVEKIKAGWRDFDVVIATPTVMPKIAILGKFLGSSGLMPNPKNGTVTKDLVKAIDEYKSGKVNIKASKDGQVQFPAGKKSMEVDKLTENLEYATRVISENVMKNSGSTIKSLNVKTSMGKPYKLS